MQVEVLFGPADFERLPAQDLRGATCVVFDVLRATSTLVTALANGARAIRPVASIEEALAERARDPEVLLAGERGGVRIGPELTGGTAFDFGNSPREFTPERVRGRTLVMTTTNGTRALKASAGAEQVFAAAFLNLGRVAGALQARPPARVLILGSGTGEEPALEDTLAAGALVELLDGVGAVLADSARIALAAWRSVVADPCRAICDAANARRLLAHPELAPDVEICLRRDTVPVLPVRNSAGEVVLGEAR